MASRRSEGHTLLWAGMGCGGAFLALLLLGGGVAALWALGYLGPRRGADAAGARADGKPDTFPVLPALPAGNPFANVLPGRKLTVANCEKVKPGMTEAEVRALLGPPVAEVPLFDVRGAGGLAERLADQWPVKGLSYAEGGNDLQVHLNRAGQVVMVTGTVDGKGIFAMAPLKSPFDNLPPGQMPSPFDRFPANSFGGMPGFPPGPFAPPGGAGAPAAPALSEALYNRVQFNMSEAEVAAVLGPPTMKLGPQLMPGGRQSADTWQWTAGAASVKVHFRDGRVVGKQSANLR